MASRNQPTPTKDSNEHGISRRQVLARGFVVAIGAAVGVTSALDNCFADRDASSGIKAALDEWRANRRNYSLTERFEILSKLVATGHPQALKAVEDEFLAKDSPKHQDKLLELIAPVVAKHFSHKGFADEWLEIFGSKDFSKINLNNCWLVYCVSRDWIKSNGFDMVQNFALDETNPLAYRMAAMKAIVSLDSASVAFVGAVLSKIPVGPPEVRGRYLETAAKIAQVSNRYNSRHPDKGDASTPGIQALISELDENLIPKQYLFRVSKIIAEIVGSKTVFRNAEGWRAYFEGRNTAEKLKAERYAVPEVPTQYFFGVPGYGLKTCYVIDLSGSMNQPIEIPRGTTTKKPNPEKKPGPITGEPEKGSPSTKDPKPPAAAPPTAPNFPGLEGLVLDRDETRLSIAKKAIKKSIRELSPKAKFSIVGFGDDGQILGDPNNMIEATPAKVQAMCAEIDRLSCDGATNLHRGLELAFSFGEKAAQKGDSLLPISNESPDVIYLLSDGVANQDSYTINKTGNLHFLYQDSQNLANSVVRANLFASAELHLISIGLERNSSLEFIARENGCEFVQLVK